MSSPHDTNRFKAFEIREVVCRILLLFDESLIFRGILLSSPFKDTVSIRRAMLSPFLPDRVGKDGNKKPAYRCQALGN